MRHFFFDKLFYVSVEERFLVTGCGLFVRLCLCHSLVRLDYYSTIKLGTSIAIHKTFATKLAPLSRIIYLDHLGAVVVLPTGAIGFLFNQLKTIENLFATYFYFIFTFFFYQNELIEYIKNYSPNYNYQTSNGNCKRPWCIISGR